MALRRGGVAKKRMTVCRFTFWSSFGWKAMRSFVVAIAPPLLHYKKG